MVIFFMYIIGTCLLFLGFFLDFDLFIMGIGLTLLIIGFLMDQRDYKKRQEISKNKRQALFKQYDEQFSKKKLSKKKNLTVSERSSLQMSSMLGDSEARNILAKNEKAQQKKKKASRKTSLKKPIEKGLTTLENMYQDALKAKLSKDLINTLDSNYKFRVESIKEYKNGKTDSQVAKEMIQYHIDEFKGEVRSITP